VCVCVCVCCVCVCVCVCVFIFTLPLISCNILVSLFDCVLFVIVSPAKTAELIDVAIEVQSHVSDEGAPRRHLANTVD